MNVVFLSPHFPPNWWRFVRGLKEVGATTLGIADMQLWSSFNPELRESLDDYYRVDDLGDYDQLTRAMGFFIHRHGRIGRLDSLNEHWLETEARLRTDFNVKRHQQEHDQRNQEEVGHEVALPGEPACLRRAARYARRRPSCGASSARWACRLSPSRTSASAPRRRTSCSTRTISIATWSISRPSTTSSRSSSAATWSPTTG